MSAYDGNALRPPTVRLTGDHTVWDDLDFAMTLRTVANEGPALVNLNSTGIYAYAFSDGKIAYFQLQIPHAFKAGQPGWMPHIHWMPTTSATYAGTFTLEFVTHGVANGDPLSNKVTRTGTFNRAVTAWQAQLTPLDVQGAINGSTFGISTLIFAKLTVALTSGTSVILSGMDWHGEIDSLGSEDEYLKKT